MGGLAKGAVKPSLVESESPAIGRDGDLVESVGLRWADGAFIQILEAGSQTPCSDSVLLASRTQSQGYVAFELCRSHPNTPAICHSLGGFRVQVVPGAMVEPQVEIVVSAQARALYVEALNRTSGDPLLLQRIQ